VSRETNISTEQSCSQTPPRLPVADGHEERAKGSGASPRKGPQASVCLSEHRSSTDDKGTSLDVPSHCVERLRVRRQFLFVANGHSERRRSVVIQARDRQDSAPKIGVGFTATKKIGGAVIRSRSKRRMREAARALSSSLGWPGSDYVFIARRDTATIEWQRLLDDVESALISLRSKLASGETPEPKNFSGRRSGRRKT